MKEVDNEGDDSIAPGECSTSWRKTVLCGHRVRQTFWGQGSLSEESWAGAKEAHERRGMKP